jgi:glycine betaine/choline ABC-type transport system substrate-binding protein
MSLIRKVASVIVNMIALLSLCGCALTGAKPVIHVGSKNFTEQVVLGEIIAQHLEHRLHQKVERSLNLGGTLLAQQALVSRQIDVYPEYTGTALAVVLKDASGSNHADRSATDVLARVRAGYLQKFHAEWLDPLGIDDSFAMVVNGPLARAQHLETLSDAAKMPQPWTLGVGYEFEQRTDGLPALEKTYQMRWSGSPKTMDLGLLYKAMEQGQVSMIAANATDGLLSKMDLKILRDDRQAFPPYQVCIVAREDSLREIPGMREALVELSGKFDNQLMQKLNFQVDVEHRSVAEVAAEFLKQAGLN